MFSIAKASLSSPKLEEAQIDFESKKEDIQKKQYKSEFASFVTVNRSKMNFILCLSAEPTKI